MPKGNHPCSIYRKSAGSPALFSVNYAISVIYVVVLFVCLVETFLLLEYELFVIEVVNTHSVANLFQRLYASLSGSLCATA